MIGIAVAVTSIPVISRIFHDLGIMHTRFARLILGVAVIEDVALWVVLAIATALAKSGAVPKTQILFRILTTLIFFAAGLTVVPNLLRRVSQARWNWLVAASPLGYLVAVMFAFCGFAALLHVNLVFASFLAGYGVARLREAFSGAVDSLARFSFAFFIPLYFLLVGFRLNLGRHYSFAMLGIFLALACGIKLISVGMGAWFAGFRGLDVLNLAIATNARGGPGIVLASVAYDAGIINAQAFTTLVLLGHSHFASGRGMAGFCAAQRLAAAYAGAYPSTCRGGDGGRHQPAGRLTAVTSCRWPAGTSHTVPADG